MTPDAAKRLALKYRRRINADVFSGGETYNESNFDLEGTSADYGHSAQTNQEILDLIEEKANQLLDQIALIYAQGTRFPAGQFLTYGGLESFIPEYIGRAIETVALEPEMVATFDLSDYGYPVALNLYITGQDGLKSAVPLTTEAYYRIRSMAFPEYDTIPVYRVTPNVLTQDVSVTCFYQGADSVSIPGGANLEFYYIARQLPIDATHDLQFSSKYDEHLLNLMVQYYEGIK